MNSRSLIISVAILTAACLGMGAYVWHTRRTVALEVPVKIGQPVAPPSSGPTEQVTLYVAYDSPGILVPEPTRIPLPEDRQQRALALMRALIARYLEKFSPHTLAPGSDVRDVYLVDPSLLNSGLAVVDFNADLANGHRSGIFVEELTLASVVQTLSNNLPGITRVKFLVEGKERETLAGHADLTEMYNVNDVAEMASALQASQ
jgi:spore germination protein GerM